MCIRDSTNAIQYAWLRVLTGNADKLMVVGDDDQSIYGWRGAKIENIQRFQLDDGSWWTGYVFTGDAYWPDEKPTWTAGAVLLAADTLFEYSRACTLFTTIES